MLLFSESRPERLCVLYQLCLRCNTALFGSVVWVCFAWYTQVGVPVGQNYVYFFRSFPII